MGYEGGTQDSAGLSLETRGQERTWDESGNEVDVSPSERVSKRMELPINRTPRPAEE